MISIHLYIKSHIFIYLKLNETEWESLVVEIYIVPLMEPNEGPQYNCN